MHKLTIIVITTMTFAIGADTAHAERADGFLRFLGAVAQAAQQAQANRNGSQNHNYYEEEAYYQQDADYGNQGYYEAGYQDQGPVVVDLRGDWVMNGGNRNRFQKTHQGYYVVPVGRGKGVQYVEIGDNLYQEARGAATYEVIDDNYMIWTSNDRRNITIELYRH